MNCGPACGLKAVFHKDGYYWCIFLNFDLLECYVLHDILFTIILGEVD